MRINPISNYPYINNFKSRDKHQNKQLIQNKKTNSHSPSFGYLIYDGPKLPYPFELDLDSSSKMSCPRIFSYENLSFILDDSKKLSYGALKAIGKNCFRDVRMAQEEAKLYATKVNEEITCKSFAYLRDVNKKELFADADYDNGKPMIRNEYYDPDDITSKTVYFFSKDGRNNRIYDVRNNKVARAFFMDNILETGKKNVITFKEDGTLDEVQIGKKTDLNGSITIDKLYKYDGRGKLLDEFATYLEQKPNGVIEMKNYIHIKPENSDAPERFVLRRTGYPDGRVEYENAIYFDGCEFLKLFTKQSLEYETELEPIAPEPIWSGEENIID